MNPADVFEKIEKSLHLLVYFSYPGCSVCISLLPKIESLVRRFANVEFLYLNTQEHPSVSGQYLVFAVPTIILFSKGAERERWSRVFGVHDVESTLSRLSEMA